MNVVLVTVTIGLALNILIAPPQSAKFLSSINKQELTVRVELSTAIDPPPSAFQPEQLITELLNVTLEPEDM